MKPILNIENLTNVLDKFPSKMSGGQRQHVAAARTLILHTKCWLIHLQQVEKKSYSSIHSIRGVLHPAFQLAVDDDLIRKNPFQFQLMEVVVNDSVTREVISRAEERKFLRFVKEDSHFCRYYEGIYILFKTGLRISEFCGLTISMLYMHHSVIGLEAVLRQPLFFLIPKRDSKMFCLKHNLIIWGDIL